MDRHIKYLDQAFDIARNSEHSFRARHAALLVFHGEIIGEGVNQKKTHPFHKRYARNDFSIYLHAETDAIHNALKSFTGIKSAMNFISKSTLYVARVKYDHISLKPILGMSKPCLGCMRAIITFNIPKIVYTMDNSLNYGVWAL